MDRVKLSAAQINRLLDGKGALILALVGMLITGVVAYFAVTKDVSIDNQQAKLTRSLCASANNVALAFREPAVGETRQHFVIRMFAQRDVLEYSFGLGCSQIEGFERLPKLRRLALAEIDAVTATVKSDKFDKSSADDGELPSQLERALEDSTTPESSDPRRADQSARYVGRSRL